MINAIYVPFTVNNEEIRRSFLQHLASEALSMLSPSTKAFWGSMNHQQMVEHLIMSLEMSNSNLLSQIEVDSKSIRERKSFLHNDLQTPHNFKVPYLEKELPPNKYTSLEESIIAFRQELASFNNYNEKDNNQIKIHPIFGPLNHDEWSRCHFKHMYRHLLQFGLIKMK